MGLLAHQTEILEAIRDNFITSISAPRQNGKTYAAIAAAVDIGGKTIFVSRGYAGAKQAFRLVEEYGADWPFPTVAEVRRTNGELSVIREADASVHGLGPKSGSIHCATYGKTGARGRVADTLIFDDANSVEADMLEAFYPAIFSASRPRIVALSVTPDTGTLAERILDRADRILQWSSENEAEANPALGSLVHADQLQRAKRVLPEDVYRRECLGLST